MTRVASVETFIVSVARDTPYLGPLGPDERINQRGYVVRTGNRTIYPTVDRSVVVRILTDDGRMGWGETYGICAPKATCEIINDLLAPTLIGADPNRVEDCWEQLYNLMRVRGCTGGFHIDAIAALDIALWDLKGQLRELPIRDLIGPVIRDRIPGYLSGLPAATLAERVALARQLQMEGHNSFKFAALVSREGINEEMAALRQALGTEAEIMVDLHWKFTSEEALDLVAALAPHRPFFVEAPVKPEDIAGLAAIATQSSVPIAAGEEWYTAFEARNRLDAAPISFVQPEMGHTGVTQFKRIADLAEARGAQVAPHATIGTGLFLAASLQVSATIASLWKHEWQHSIFDNGLALLETDMGYADGHYGLPSGPGLGARPSPRFWDHAELIE